MNEIFKLFGIGLLLISALVFSVEYEKRIKAKNELSEAFIMLLSHIRRQIDCYLTPQSHLTDGFENEVLEKCGFSELAARDGVASAFLAAKDSLVIYNSIKKELTGFFSGFGKDYKSGTIKELDSLISSITEKLKKEKEESEKDIKVARTLAVAAALGAAILII